jgi:hypothetical protein
VASSEADPAARHAARLLDLSGHPDRAERIGTSDALADWAASGAMHLTGRPDGPPLVHTGPAAALRGALSALAALSPGSRLPGVELLGERAAISGLTRQGSTSCGGATRLLRSGDRLVALTLARDEDLSLVPALVEHDVADPWEAVERWLARTAATDALERATLLGLPFTLVGERAPGPAWAVSLERTGARPDRPRVVDLSALWAGPLCASLLGLLGCSVVKVEDPQRPDGARRGPAAFFDLMNAGAESVVADLRSAQVQELVAGADVVIEASRPRALRNAGLVVEDIVAGHDVTWVSITGHGRAQEDRVGFGDDAAAAGGLVVDGCFVGDAVADPLTGVHAALAAWGGILHGGARLIDVSLAGVAAAASELTVTSSTTEQRGGAWWVGGHEVRLPHARASRGVGPAQTGCSL